MQSYTKTKELTRLSSSLHLMSLSFKIGFYPSQGILYSFGFLQVFRLDDNLINSGQIDKVWNILGTIILYYHEYLQMHLV